MRAAALALLLACGGEPPAVAPAVAPPVDAAPPPPVDAEVAPTLDEAMKRLVPPTRPSAGLEELELLAGEDETLNIPALIRNYFWDGVERCYDEARAGKTGFEGRVVVTFTILKTSRVVRTEVKGFDPGLDACIAARVEKWHFPIKEGVKTYRATFDLHVDPPRRGIGH